MPIAIAPWFVKVMIVVLEMDVKPGQNVMEQIVARAQIVAQAEVVPEIIVVPVRTADQEEFVLVTTAV